MEDELQGHPTSQGALRAYRLTKYNKFRQLAQDLQGVQGFSVDHNEIRKSFVSFIVKSIA